VNAIQHTDGVSREDTESKFKAGVCYTDEKERSRTWTLYVSRAWIIVVWHCCSPISTTQSRTFADRRSQTEGLDKPAVVVFLSPETYPTASTRRAVVTTGEIDSNPAWKWLTFDRLTLAVSDKWRAWHIQRTVAATH